MNEGVGRCLLPKETGCFRSLGTLAPLFKTIKAFFWLPGAVQSCSSYTGPDFQGLRDRMIPKREASTCVNSVLGIWRHLKGFFMFIAPQPRL